MQTQSGKTTRQHIKVKPEELVMTVLQKVSRQQLGGALLGKSTWMKQTKLTAALLREIRDHYVTLPQSVRVALEDFLSE